MNERVLQTLLFKEFFIAGRLRSPRVGHFPFYPDFRVLFSHTEKLAVIAEELAKKIAPLKPDIIASREAAGVPYGVAVALVLKTNFLYLRKEPKGYNTNKVIEGWYQPGQTVVAVDDAVSTGGDKKKIVETLENVGLHVKGVAVVMDSCYGPKYRENQQWLRANNPYKFIYLFTWPDLMDYLAEQKFLSSELCAVIKDWLNDPAEWQKNEQNWQQFKELVLQEKNLTRDESFNEL